MAATLLCRCVGVSAGQRVTTVRFSNVQVARIVAMLAKGPRSS